MLPVAVSVLVTVYNREPYLAACLESILASTWQDFEVIVVDDGSSDQSVQIAKCYADQDQRIRFFKNEKNLGDYPNRVRAASYATGKYLKYVDADDLIYPQSLAIMVHALERFPRAGLALSANMIDPEQPYPFCWEPVHVYRAHFLGRSILGVGPSAAIIRSECFHAVGGFNNRQFVGDIELWLKLAERWPVVALPPSLVWWRRHVGQQMAVEISKPDVMDVRFKLAMSILNDTGLLALQDKKLALERLRQQHARRLLALGLKQKKPAVAWALFKKSGLGPIELLNGLKCYH